MQLGEILSGNAKTFLAVLSIGLAFAVIRIFLNRDPPSVPRLHPHTALVLSDSMCNFKSTQELDVRRYPGFTTKDLIRKLYSTPELMAPVIIIHVGTNDIGGKEFHVLFNRFKNGLVSREKYEEAKRTLTTARGRKNETEMLLLRFKNDYQRLLRQVHSMNPDTFILASSILPRFFDYESSRAIVSQMNEIIESLIIRSNGSFLSLAKDFEDVALFNPDGLHLNGAGLAKLKQSFIDHLHKL